MSAEADSFAHQLVRSSLDPNAMVKTVRERPERYSVVHITVLQVHIDRCGQEDEWCELSHDSADEPCVLGTVIAHEINYLANIAKRLDDKYRVMGPRVGTLIRIKFIREVVEHPSKFSYNFIAEVDFTGEW